MLKQRKVNGQSVSRQLATSSQNLVASTQFLVALATSESQFRALADYDFWGLPQKIRTRKATEKINKLHHTRK